MSEQVIYESPDKGSTVYAREFGAHERVKISEQLDSVKEDRLWRNIRFAAKNNPELNKALEAAVCIYKMSNN